MAGIGETKSISGDFYKTERKPFMADKNKANTDGKDLSKPHKGLQSDVLAERVAAINFLGECGSRESLVLLKDKIKIILQEYIALTVATGKLKHKYRVR